ncbi:endolytic transglycosylase MltG [Nocardioides sp. Iso805N]|uniref:endolytic transglycosylase MltG n=1 Tax=Nocardioides sp. Iso805N TaxID=1283287 RepID=UPI00037A3EFC|nr:endolytic transglycosylase MltG [Nocardioides sp. Iso805N]
MSDGQDRHGFAPEPPGSFRGDPLNDPLSDPLSDPWVDRSAEGRTDRWADAEHSDVPEYAAGDTGTRAVPIVPSEDEPVDASADVPDVPDQPTEPSSHDEPAPRGTHAAAYPDDHLDDHPGEYLAEDPADYAAERDAGEHHEPLDDHLLGAAPALDAERGGRRAGPRRTRRGRSLPGCLAALVALGIVVGLLALGGAKGYSLLKDHLGGSAADYPGPGTGGVTFEVHKGDSATVIGRNLKSAGVVQSVGAFVDAAQANPDSGRIQVGFYQLKKQMKASDALGVLVDPKSLIQNVVVVPEGARVDQIVSSIVAKTDIKRADLVAALKDSSALGLPAAAKGNPEGYLFPATYSVVPGETAAELLKQMVDKGTQVRKELGVDTAAAKVGLTPEQVVTVASILEYEARRSEDYPKVARAIYNRLKANMPLQSDATVSYANKVSGEVWTTAQQRQNASPYNTYQHTGLPPGPIGNPGETTLKAALNPAAGPWLYWVVVNLKTGETIFSTTLAEHEAATQKFRDYCKTSDAC